MSGCASRTRFGCDRTGPPGRRAAAGDLDLRGRGDAVRGMHRQAGARARRAARRGGGAGQFHQPPGARRSSRRDRRGPADRRDRRAGLHRPRLRGGNGGRRQERIAPAGAGDGGGRLRDDERDAAVGVDLVRRERRDAAIVPLALRADRAADRRLFRPRLLRERVERAEARSHQHGRADLDRRAADPRDEPL